MLAIGVIANATKTPVMMNAAPVITPAVLRRP
jgi:hypothetical protein